MRRHSELQLALEQEKTRRELAVLDEKRKDAERKELAQQQEASRKANDARKSVQEKKHARLKALKRLKRDYLRTKAMIDGSDLAKEDRAAALNVAYQEYMEAKSRLSEGLYE
jgi:tRNA uridine 5-carbamoylmethylation protein Kti12